MNPPQVYMFSPSWTLLPPHTIPLFFWPWLLLYFWAYLRVDLKSFSNMFNICSSLRRISGNFFFSCEWSDVLVSLHASLITLCWKLNILNIMWWLWKSDSFTFSVFVVAACYGLELFLCLVNFINHLYCGKIYILKFPILTILKHMVQWH